MKANSFFNSSSTVSTVLFRMKVTFFELGKIGRNRMTHGIDKKIGDWFVIRRGGFPPIWSKFRIVASCSKKINTLIMAVWLLINSSHGNEITTSHLPNCSEK